ncbi:MAG TPA: FUSC family protein [Alphaproteobacteria bacterium]
MQNVSDAKTLSLWDVVYALNMAIACLISYWIMTDALSRFVDMPSDLLGGMWAVVAAVFVFRETRVRSLSAGIARLIATCVSFALCFLYLLLFPFTPVGMAALIGIGTVAMALLDRRDDIVTVGITTAVVMVVAAMSPEDAWHQPLLRLADTIVGIAVGVACKWLGSFLFYKFIGGQVA